ncbi:MULTISPECIES: NAD(P)-dependent oxidoreductase [Listeria]|uniref:NAD(P)-dependent oxidoreductase n=1 Tax=Listeria TaxID=1637 RepID=UPI000B593BC3|nr:MULTISPECIES: NAD(P)-dependent oxidoreductase [Listeria]
MKVAIIAASGKAGNQILEEAVRRGMEVTAIVRHKEKITNPNVQVLEKDLFDLTFEDIQDQDVVIDAFNAPHGQEELHQTSLKHVTSLLKGKTNRLLVVGGAGSLYVDEAESLRLMDTPDFPVAFLPTASHMGKALDALKQEAEVNWTYMSPSAFFNPEGAGTGTYILGENQLLVDETGQSEVSYANFAKAMLDEIEEPKHVKERFTVRNK